MIVLEGPDGSGKSTLAQLIQLVYPDYNIIHSPGPCPREVFQERIFWNLEMSKIKNLIVDRISIISEVIYGTVLRGESFINDQDIRDFLGEFYNHKYNIIVFCNRDLGAIQKHEKTLYMSSKDKIVFEKKVDKNLDKIRIAYEEFFQTWTNIFQNVHLIQINSALDYIKLFKLLRETQNECKRC